MCWEVKEAESGLLTNSSCVAGGVKGRQFEGKVRREERRKVGIMTVMD